MAQALRASRPAAGAHEVLREMRARLQAVGREALQAAGEAGEASAQAQIAAYRADGLRVQVAGERLDVEALLSGWMLTFEQQAQAVQVVLAAGQDTTLILGDNHRLGLLQPAPAATGAAHWLAGALGSGVALWTVGRVPDERIDWHKQAIAALDERTTDCCLRAHAQVVPLRRRFRLTGTPRFADRLDWTPFHWWCRTSVALYLPQYEDGITAQMRSAADAELAARAETDERVEIHPAHARSRR